MKKSAILCTCLLLSYFAMAQQDIAFSAKVDKDTLRIGETFKIEFLLEGGKFKNFSLPDFEGFEIVNGPFQSSQMQVMNGEVSQRASYTYHLRPAQNGDFTILAARTEVGGKTMRTEPIQLFVLDEKIDPNYTPMEQERIDPFGFPFPKEEKKKKKRRVYKI